MCPPHRRRSGENALPSPEPAAAPSPVPRGKPVPAKPAKANRSRAEHRPWHASEPPPEAKTADPTSDKTNDMSGDRAGDRATVVDAKRNSDNLSLTFSFASRHAGGAVSPRRHGLAGVRLHHADRSRSDPQQGRYRHRRRRALMKLDKGQAIRIRLNRPQMPSLAGDDQAGGVIWTLTFADIDASAAAAADRAAKHRRSDPRHRHGAAVETRPACFGWSIPKPATRIMVVTAPPPVRGFIKRQDFVEMSLLESIQGVVVRPNSDDVTAESLGRQDHPRQARRPDAVVGRRRQRTARPPRAVRFSTSSEWRKNREESFVAAARRAGRRRRRRRTPDARTPAQIDLARFYMARAMYHEAKAVLDLDGGGCQARPGRSGGVDRSCGRQHS